MKLQFSIVSLLALNYLVALYFANTIGATLFLFLFQPLIVLLAASLLDFAVPKQLTSAARENSRRMNGSRSQRRHDRERYERKKLRHKIFLLFTLVTILFNFVVLLADVFPIQLGKLHVLIIPAVIGLTAVFMFAVTRSIYLALIRQYADEIADRHLKYVQFDMDNLELQRQAMQDDLNAQGQLPEHGKSHVIAHQT